jgi:hypothetical protein
MLKTNYIKHDNTIRLVDTTLENADILTSFFDLVYFGKIPLFSIELTYMPLFMRLLSLSRLLNKLGSVAYTRLFKSALGDQIQPFPSEKFNMLYFVLAAAVDDVELAHKAMANSGEAGIFTSTGGRGSPEELDKTVKCGRYWQLASLPLPLYRLIPPEYMLAFERSVRGIGGSELEPPRKAAYKFRELINENGAFYGAFES